MVRISRLLASALETRTARNASRESRLRESSTRSAPVCVCARLECVCVWQQQARPRELSPLPLWLCVCVCFMCARPRLVENRANYTSAGAAVARCPLLLRARPKSVAIRQRTEIGERSPRCPFLPLSADVRACVVRIVCCCCVASVCRAVNSITIIDCTVAPAARAPASTATTTTTNRIHPSRAAFVRVCVRAL